MTPSQYTQLAADVRSRFGSLIAALPADDGGSGFEVACQPIATALAALAGTPVQTAISMSSALKWAAGFSLLVPLQTAAANPQSPVQNIAAAALMMFQGGLPQLDLTDSGIQTMIAALVSVGMATSAQSSALFAMGQIATNYAMATYGLVPTMGDICHALRGNP